VPDLNLLDFLSADHENLLEAAPAPGVADVSQHLSVERDFLYPTVSHHVPKGKEIVDDLRHAARELEDCLTEFEKDDSPENQQRLRDEIKKHVTSQEELFIHLRELIPESALLKPVEVIALSIGGAPTHAHKHLSEGGRIADLVEDFTSAADRTLDRLHHRKHSESG
jgi:hypothetical protein